MDSEDHVLLSTPYSEDSPDGSSLRRAEVWVWLLGIKCERMLEIDLKFKGTMRSPHREAFTRRVFIQYLLQYCQTGPNGLLFVLGNGPSLQTY